MAHAFLIGAGGGVKDPALPHFGGAERRESGQHLRPCSHRGYI
jgi:hypothetical protein